MTGTYSKRERRVPVMNRETEEVVVTAGRLVDLPVIHSDSAAQLRQLPDMFTCAVLASTRDKRPEHQRSEHVPSLGQRPIGA